ncbi:hypothetical protein KR215_012181, partial [Drosophila sulfurigaster]
LITSQLKILFNLSTVSQESGAAIKELHGTIQRCLTALDHSDISVSSPFTDCILAFLCSSKLPKLTLSLWEQSLVDKAKIPAWQDISTFLNERYRTLEVIEDVKQTANSQNATAGPSRPQSSKRVNSFEARQYNAVLQEYVDLGHMTPISPKAIVTTPNFYLPHHAVFKPDSTTTKVRVVFDDSCPSSIAKSLNDILHSGAILQTDRYVFNADITKSYRQILMDSKHTPFKRILFRTSNGEISDFELNTVTFGVNCAPFLALRVLQQLAEDIRLEYPLASRVISSSVYVDDVLAGTHTKEEAIRTIAEVCAA